MRQSCRTYRTGHLFPKIAHSRYTHLGAPLWLEVFARHRQPPALLPYPLSRLRSSSHLRPSRRPRIATIASIPRIRFKGLLSARFSSDTPRMLVFLRPSSALGQSLFRFQDHLASAKSLISPRSSFLADASSHLSPEQDEHRKGFSSQGRSCGRYEIHYSFGTL